MKFCWGRNLPGWNLGEKNDRITPGFVDPAHFGWSAGKNYRFPEKCRKLSPLFWLTKNKNLLFNSPWFNAWVPMKLRWQAQNLWGVSFFQNVTNSEVFWKGQAYVESLGDWLNPWVLGWIPWKTWSLAVFILRLLQVQIGFRVPDDQASFVVKVWHVWHFLGTVF